MNMIIKYVATVYLFNEEKSLQEGFICKDKRVITLYRFEDGDVTSDVNYLNRVINYYKNNNIDFKIIEFTNLKKVNRKPVKDLRRYIKSMVMDYYGDDFIYECDFDVDVLKDMREWERTHKSDMLDMLGLTEYEERLIACGDYSTCY